MKKVKLFIMDVDGTLTDGRIYIGAQGEIMKAFDARDGYAIAHILPQLGITSAIITGRFSSIVEHRAKELEIMELYQGVSDKLATLRAVVEKFGVSADEVAYIGDDLNDIDCIRYCGVTACPADAVSEVIDAVDYLCHHDGGRGAVREFIDYIRERHWQCN